MFAPLDFTLQVRGSRQDPLTKIASIEAPFTDSLRLIAPLGIWPPKDTLADKMKFLGGFYMWQAPQLVEQAPGFNKNKQPEADHVGLSENSVPLNPMVLLIIIPTKWL